MTKPLNIKNLNPSEAVIDTLKELLVKAEDAVITDILVLTRERGDGIYTYRCIDDDQQTRFLGELEWLKWTFVERMGRTRVDPE